MRINIFSRIFNKTQRVGENPTYRRHWIFWFLRIEAPIPNKSLNRQNWTGTDGNTQKRTATDKNKQTLNHLTFVDINPDTKIIPNREKITDGNGQKRIYTEIQGHGEMEEDLGNNNFLCSCIKRHVSRVTYHMSCFLCHQPQLQPSLANSPPLFTVWWYTKTRKPKKTSLKQKISKIVLIP